MSNYNNYNNQYYNVRPVNKVVYLLLCWFLGGIGIQKFYAGKNTAGILCLLFCWTFIPAIIALFDFFIVLFKPADVQGNVLL